MRLGLGMEMNFGQGEIDLSSPLVWREILVVSVMANFPLVCFYEACLGIKDSLKG